MEKQTSENNFTVYDSLPASFEVLCREPLFIWGGWDERPREAVPKLAEVLAGSAGAGFRESAGVCFPESARAYFPESARAYFPDFCGKMLFLLELPEEEACGEIVKKLGPYASEFVCVTADSERAIPAQKLAEILKEEGYAATACDSVEEGIRLSLQKATESNGSLQEAAYPGGSLQKPVNSGRVLAVIAMGSLSMADAVHRSFPLLCKKQQRRLAVARRRALSQEERDEKSRVISEKLISILAGEEYEGVKTIFSYRGTWEEVNVDLFNDWAQAHGYRVAYPISLPRGIMKAAVPGKGAAGGGVAGVAGGDGAGVAGVVWRRAAYGILEPVMERAQILEPEEIDLIIVPCVAFDPQGNRCGHGAGYYDRFLTRMAPEALIMVAFEAQKIETLMTEETDLPIPKVVTELFAGMNETSGIPGKKSSIQ